MTMRKKNVMINTDLMTKEEFKMLYRSKKLLSLSLAAVLSASVAQPALAAVTYMPDAINGRTGTKASTMVNNIGAKGPNTRKE